MPTDHKTPHEIERDIERERAELAGTVNELQDRFSPDYLIREVARGFSEHGGDFGRSVRDSVKQNPVGLALTGIGLAWMMFGRSYEDRPANYEEVRRRRMIDARADRVAKSYDKPSPDGYADINDDGDDFDEVDDPAFETARPRRRAAAYGATRRYPTRTRWAYADVESDWDDDDWDDDEDDRDGLGDRAARGARSVRDGAASGASSVAESVRRAGQGAADAGRSASDRAARMRDSLAEGTQDLSDAARARVIDARARFIDARRRADRAARDYASWGADGVSDFIEKQPLVAGALALAVGAALAGSLPRTRREDEMFGEKSDQLYDEAERIFRRERAKVEDVARAAADEARTIVDEKHRQADESAPGRKSAVEAASDEVRTASERIADRAKEEADDRNLGTPDRS